MELMARIKSLWTRGRRNYLLLLTDFYLFPKILYYWLLCLLFSTEDRGPHRISLIKERIKPYLPGSKNSAIRLIITCDVRGVGFSGWIYRKARIHGLDSLARPSGKKRVEAVLVGEASMIQSFLPSIWKGPKTARVVMVEERWFNGPISREREESLPERDESISYSHKMGTTICKNIEYLAPMMDSHNQFSNHLDIGDEGEIEAFAREKNLFVSSSGKSNYLISPEKAIGLQSSQSSRVSSLLRWITDHKGLTKELLAREGLPVPQGSIFTDKEKALAYKKTCHHPLVVKPISGSHGRGVTVPVVSEEDFHRAWEYAREYHQQILLEELVVGVDVRVLVIGGVARSALLRLPAHVVGDGIHTVEELIYAKNRRRVENPRLAKKKLIPDRYSKAFLKEQGYSLESIPPQGTILFLHLKANIGAGGDSLIITHRIHPDLMALAQEAASVFGVDDFWGIDLLVEWIHRPRHEQRCTIIEVNSRAALRGVQYPMYGEPFHAASCLIQHLFSEDTHDSSYPLEKVKLTITGIFHEDIVPILTREAKEVGLLERLEYSHSTIEGQLSGPRHHLLNFLDRLWDFSQDGILIDGLSISPVDEPSYREDLEEEVKRFDHGQLEVTDYQESYMVSREGLSLQEEIFIEEFRRQGYEASFIHEGLVRIERDRCSYLTSIRHSSDFCDSLCSHLDDMKKILSFHYLPVLRGVCLKSSEMDRALEYFHQLQSPLLLTALHKKGAKKYYITERRELIRHWIEARKRGTGKILLEEYFEGFEVWIPVVKREALGAIVVEPVSIIGDGQSTILQLIEEKNRLYRENPYYRERPIQVEDTLKDWKVKDRTLKDTPEIGERIFLESRATKTLGGEATGLSHLLHKDFLKKAVQTIDVIMGLEYAVVKMILSNPGESPRRQRWVVYGIETDPSIGLFHFPWRGEPLTIAHKVVRLSLKRKILFKDGRE